MSLPAYISNDSWWLQLFYKNVNEVLPSSQYIVKLLVTNKIS